MDTLNVWVTVGNLETGASETVTAAVHQRDTFSMMPSSLLRRLGIVTSDVAKLARVNGAVEEYDTGYVTFATAGRRGYARVVFGPEGEYRIGMTTLADLALEVDTESGRLVRVNYLLPSLWPVDWGDSDQEQEQTNEYEG